MEFFCIFCGTRTDGNTTESVVDNNWNINCTVCGGAIGFYVHHRPTKTGSEVRAIFQATELTDSQKGTKKRYSSVKNK